jgi:hypothetical protein
MDYWKILVDREPELLGIEQACRAARQQGAAWVDFELEHVDRITILASRLPSPALRSKAMRVILNHLVAVWNSAMDSPPTAQAWDPRPAFVADPGGAQ